MSGSDLILLGEYGSVAQGTATADSDHDYMGIVIETQAQVIGMEEFHTKRQADAKQGEKSKPGESDTTYHSLRKFAKLAAGGNPTVGSLLHLQCYDVLTDYGRVLVDHRDLFWSKRAGYAYLGYLKAQIKSIEERKSSRPELVEKYGYDIKFGYHAYRLGEQGISYMAFKSPMIPLTGNVLRTAQAIRAGEVDLYELTAKLAGLETWLKRQLDEDGFIPDEPDYDKINELLIDLHQEHWADREIINH